MILEDKSTKYESKYNKKPINIVPVTHGGKEVESDYYKNR